MSNIIGMITVLVGAVGAGVSVWFVSRQQRQQEQEHHQQTERRLLAQLEQERHQRQEVDRQRQQEQEHHQQTERRLLAQLEQERHQREEIERQRQQEQQHHQETERRLLAQLEQERRQRQEIERQRQQEQERHQETERRLLAQLEQERRQHQEVSVSPKDSNQEQNQEATPPEPHFPSWDSFNHVIQTGIGDLEKSLTNSFEEVATPTPERTPNFVSKLRDLLASGKWEKADKETLKIMLQVAGREKKGWLDVASIENFPCEEFRVIDQLWLQYSNGRFGFSVQKHIWKSVGGNLKADDKIYKAFGDLVEWRVNENWLQINDLTFEPSAPIGHLPATAVRLGGLSWGVDGFWWEKREAYVFLLSEKDW
jgi:hypothetical protein